MSSIWEQKYGSQQANKPTYSAPSVTPIQRTNNATVGSYATPFSSASSFAAASSVPVNQSLDVNAWIQSVERDSKLHAAAAYADLTHGRGNTAAAAQRPTAEEFQQSLRPQKSGAATASSIFSDHSFSSFFPSSSPSSSVPSTATSTLPAWPKDPYVQSTLQSIKSKLMQDADDNIDDGEDDDDPFAVHDSDRMSRKQKSTPTSFIPSSSFNTSSSGKLLETDESDMVASLLERAKLGLGHSRPAAPYKSFVTPVSESNATAAATEAKQLLDAWKLKQENEKEAEAIKSRAKYESRIKSDGVLPLTVSSNTKPSATLPSSSSSAAAPPVGRSSNPLFSRPVIPPDENLLPKPHMTSTKPNLPESVNPSSMTSVEDEQYEEFDVDDAVESHDDAPQIPTTYLPTATSKARSSALPPTGMSSRDRKNAFSLDEDPLLYSTAASTVPDLTDIPEETESAVNTARTASTARSNRQAPVMENNDQYEDQDVHESERISSARSSASSGRGSNPNSARNNEHYAASSHPYEFDSSPPSSGRAQGAVGNIAAHPMKLSNPSYAPLSVTSHTTKPARSTPAAAEPKPAGARKENVPRGPTPSSSSIPPFTASHVSRAKFDSSVSAIDEQFRDDSNLVQQGRARANQSKEKGWNSSMKPMKTPSTASNRNDIDDNDTHAPEPAATPAKEKAPAASTGAGVAHPKKFHISASSTARSSPLATPPPSQKSVPSTSPHGPPSAVEARLAARSEKPDAPSIYTNRLELFVSKRNRSTRRRLIQAWRSIACLPREKHVHARAFANFQLLLRTITRWSAAAKYKKQHRVTAAAEEETRKELLLNKRADKFYKVQRLEHLFKSWFDAAQTLRASHAETDARNQRAAKMTKLLEALEKKKAGASATSSAASSARSHATEQEENDSKDKFKRAGSIAGSTTASKAKKPASTTSNIALSGDAAAVAYKEKLLEARRAKSATHNAAAGASAIEKGSSVHARTDLHEALLQSGNPSSAPSSNRSNQSTQSASSSVVSAAPSLLSNAPGNSGFSVASATTMEERAALRAMRRAELDRIHAEKEAAKQAEIERVKREAVEAEAETKRLEAMRKRELKRAEKEAAAARMAAAELDSQKSMLASLHHVRSRLLFYGWNPWRKLLEMSRIRSRKMDAHANAHRIKHFFHRWQQAVAIGHEQRRLQEEKRIAKARAYYIRKKLKQTFRQWKRILSFRAKDMDEKRDFYAATLLRRAFHRFLANVNQRNTNRVRREKMLEPVVRNLSIRVLKRHYFINWKRCCEHRRQEKKLKLKQQDMKSKVGGWLEEFRAEKAKQRGVLDIGGTSQPAFSFQSSDLNSKNISSYSATPSALPLSERNKSLQLDIPSSNANVGGMLSPSKSGYSASTGPLSPSQQRYSALSHLSAASPRNVIASGNVSASSSASANSSYSDFLTSLSPRAHAPTMTHTNFGGPTSPSRLFDSSGSARSPTAATSASHSTSTSSAYSALNSPKYQSLLQSKAEEEMKINLEHALEQQHRKPASTQSAKRSVAPAVTIPTASSTTASKRKDTAPSTTASSSKHKPAVQVDTDRAAHPLKSALSPTSKYGQTYSGGSVSKDKSAELSGTNLSATAIRKVTFEPGVGLRPQPLGNATPAGSTNVKGPVAPPSSSGISLIQAAKAKAMELDALDGDSASFKPGASNAAVPPHMFNIAATQKKPTSNISYEQSMDEESVDEFDKQFEMMLTKSGAPSAKTSVNRPTSAPKRANIHNSYDDDSFDTPSGSARGSVASTTSISSGASSAQTRTAQHGNPSMSLAAARAARREQDPFARR